MHGMDNIKYINLLNFLGLFSANGENKERAIFFCVWAGRSIAPSSHWTNVSS
jgi:hypothetical protein